MTPTLQDFYAECVASIGNKSQSILTSFTDFQNQFSVSFSSFDQSILITSNEDPDTEGMCTLYCGTDIRRAASILYGVTGDQRWLRFVEVPK